MLKCADVSNPAKPFDLYAEWTARIMEEFYLQGDIERAIGLAISRFMDREQPEVCARARVCCDCCCCWFVMLFFVLSSCLNVCFGKLVRARFSVIV